MASIQRAGRKWMVRVRRKGYPIQAKVFPTKAMAEAWARKTELEIDEGRAGLSKPERGTLRSLIERYEDEVGSAKPFGRNKADVLKKLRELLGDEPAGALTTDRIVRYITKDRKVSGVTASIDLTYLKGVLKFAAALWRMNVRPSVVDEAREILKHMGSVSASKERDRRPTASEIDAIKGYLAGRSSTLTPDHIDFILDSCFRPPSEICRLRWEDWNEDEGTILIRDRKDPQKKLGNHQTVPLLGRCAEIIRGQPRASEFIFPVNGGSWSSLFPRACNALGIEDLQLYDLRHEAISRLVESGKYSIPEMCLITGHKNPKMLMRYTQLRARDLVGR